MSQLFSVHTAPSSLFLFLSGAAAVRAAACLFIIHILGTDGSPCPISACAKGLRPFCAAKKSSPRKGNVIQIRMAERELELKQVPVSFFVKKYLEKGLTRQAKCAAAFATELKKSVAKAALESR